MAKAKGKPAGRPPARDKARHSTRTREALVPAGHPDAAPGAAARATVGGTPFVPTAAAAADQAVADQVARHPVGFTQTDLYLLPIAERQTAALLAAAADRPPPPPKGKRPNTRKKGGQRGTPDPSQPTADELEARILESLANPAHRPLTIEQRCEVLGIHRGTWYRRTTDPLFRTRAADAFRAAVGDTLGPVLDVLVHSALVEGKDGHQDRRLYLQLVGVVDDGNPARSRRPADDDDGKKKPPAAEMDDAELLAAFEGRTELLPPGILRRLGQDPDAGKTNGDGTA